MQRANIISGGVLVLFSLALLFWLIPQYVETTEGDFTMSPRLVPDICGYALLALSVLLIVTNIRNPAAGQTPPFTRRELLVMAAVAAVVSVSALLFVYVHQIAAGGFVVVGLLFIMGERRPLPYIIIPAGLMLLVYLLFYQLLGTALE